MIGPPDDADALAATLVDVDPQVSIRPAVRVATRPLAISTGASAGTSASANGLVLGPKLGEGGMAVVFAGTQTALEREVAIKTSRDADPRAMDALLDEARITGRLEHPNIVPVHDLGQDEHGRPLIVLKRIEGTEWSATMASRPLEWNLAQLVQVCHAVAFAHSRGIVHRDLKPSNVMIGGFGEVYVLDWGIAVPAASTPGSVAGTLAYMAPEMLACGEITPRSDIYLLGAIIYQILAGRPPHLGSSVKDSVDSIWRSEPPLPDEAPQELVAIARVAMARVPEQRFATVDELRIALLGFLEHRNSAEVARMARERLIALEAHLAGDGERFAAYQLFGQCRFGFQEALRTWPDNSVARAGVERALVAMVRYELGQSDARAASLLLAELATPPAELVAQVAELERAQQAKASELAALARDHDVTVGSGMRTVFVVLFGLLWAAMPVLAKLFPNIDADHGTSILIGSVSLVFLVAFLVAMRREVVRTSYNRGAAVAIVLGLALHIAVEAATWMLGLDMVATHAIALALWCGACCTAAVFLERALLFPGLGFFAAMVIAVRWPEWRFWAMSVSLTGFAFTGAYTWWAGRRGRRLGGLANLLVKR